MPSSPGPVRNRITPPAKLSAQSISRGTGAPGLLRKILIALSLVCLFALLPTCLYLWETLSSVDLEDIQAEGKIKVITGYSATGYFIYKGQPMGYDYELLQMLARELNVELEIVVTREMDDIVYALNSGEGHLVAANIAVTLERAREVDFTEHLLLTRQVLVQRKPDPDLGQTRDLIRNPVELIGKQVHVRRGSSYYDRLKNLEQEIGGFINIETVAGNVITEKLIQMVHKGEIDFTIADEPTALLNQTYYTNLDVTTPISFPQRIAWIVRSQSPRLRSYINDWIRRIKSQGTLASIYGKYYRNSRAFGDRQQSDFYSVRANKISVYDSLIKAGAKELGWDWRLLASLIYQESRFNPKARSWAGAQGLMQLMPPTARMVGAKNTYDPGANIAGGVAYLKFLTEEWKDKIKDPDERIKFILASYNAGPGHVEDARILARHFGKNPNVWDKETAPFILKLSLPRFYNNYGVKKGYCRGEEPFNYVTEILERSRQYQKLIKDSAPL